MGARKPEAISRGKKSFITISEDKPKGMARINDM
jgi:hypothetical protein